MERTEENAEQSPGVWGRGVGAQGLQIPKDLGQVYNRKAKIKPTKFPKVLKNSTLPERGPSYPKCGQSAGQPHPSHYLGALEMQSSASTPVPLN